MDEGRGSGGRQFPASGASQRPGLGTGASSLSSHGVATVPSPRTSAPTTHPRWLNLLGALLALPGQRVASLSLGVGTHCSAPGLSGHLPDFLPRPGSCPWPCLPRKGQPGGPALLPVPPPPPSPSLGFRDQEPILGSGPNPTCCLLRPQIISSLESSASMTPLPPTHSGTPLAFPIPAPAAPAPSSRSCLGLSGASPPPQHSLQALGTCPFPCSEDSEADMEPMFLLRGPQAQPVTTGGAGTCLYVRFSGGGLGRVCWGEGTACVQACTQLEREWAARPGGPG